MKTYPKPDAKEATALQCDCQALQVKWGGPSNEEFFYDPNAEDAAEFICTEDVPTDAGEYIIQTDNLCVLYCDRQYVTTATCVSGKWTGQPEWGFWCYAEPTALTPDKI